MATRKGSEGRIKVGSDFVAEVRSYSIEETGDTLEITTMGDSNRTYLSSMTSWSASVDVYWDETDAGQVALSNGSIVSLYVYPEGADGFDTAYTGNAIVTGVTKSASFDGLVEMSVSLQGTGQLNQVIVSP